MRKRKKATKLTAQEAEAKLRLLFRPWLYQMFQYKMRLQFWEFRMMYIVAHGLKPEEAGLRACLAMENSWLKTDWLRMNRDTDYLNMQVKKIVRNTEASWIEIIKSVSRSFLLEYRKNFDDVVQCEDSDWMTGEDLEDLVNLAVFTYLEIWLDKDRSSFLTIEEFTNYGYGGKNGGSGETTDYASRKKALHQAYHAFEDMHKLHQKMKLEKTEITHPVSYKRGNKRKLSLLDLAWCDAFSSRDIEIFRQLFMRRHLINRKSVHDARQNEKLYEVLKRYADFIKKTKDSYPRADQKIGEYKAYIAKCILIQRMERTYHFGLIGYLAEYSSEHGLDADAYDKVLLSTYVGEHQDEDWIIFRHPKFMDEEGKRKYQKSYRPYRTLGYEQIVEQLFDISDAGKNKKLGFKELKQRNAMDDLMAVLIDSLPYARRSWREEDFIAAAEFLDKDYMFLYNYMEWEPQNPAKQVTEEKQVQKFYDDYHAYFVELLKDEQTQTKRIISEQTKK